MLLYIVPIYFICSPVDNLVALNEHFLDQGCRVNRYPPGQMVKMNARLVPGADSDAATPTAGPLFSVH